MEKARKAMAPLLPIILDFHVSCNKSLNLFHSFIKPIALYNSENMVHLTHHQIRSLEENKTTLLEYLTKSELNILHQRFLKNILGVKRNCSNFATLGELGEFPLQMYGFISLLTFWYRTPLMNDDTLVKKTLNIVINNGPEFSEWLATVKFLLKLLHLEEYFLDPTTISTDKFRTMCQSKIKHAFIEQWKIAISRESFNNGKSNKLRFYSQFKTSFEREPYLDSVNNFDIRKTLAKFRCSDHTLEIESGRHRNTNVNERICKICNTGIENEIHFLALCPLYKPLRNRYFRNVQENDYVNLLKCSDKGTAFKFGNYIMKALKLRKDTLLALKNPENSPTE